MATKSTNKTIFAIGIVAILGFLAYKLWPAIQKKLNSSGGGSAGGGAGSVGSGGSPYQPGSGPQPPSINLGGFPSNPSSGNQNALLAGIQQAWANLVQAGTYAGSTPAQQEYIDSQVVTPGSAQFDDNDADYPDSIPLVPTQNYDVNQNAYSAGDDDGTDALSYDDGVSSSGDGSDLSDYGFAYGTGGDDGGPYEDEQVDYSSGDDSDDGD